MIELFECKSGDVQTLFEDENNSYDITQFLIKNVDWNYIFSLMISLKRKYNTGAETFIKADIIGEAIEKASKGKIIYINEKGCDFYIPSLKIRIEMKSGMKIFPKTGKKFTETLKIKNFRSLKEIDINKIEKTFDYLLLLEPTRVGIVDFDKAIINKKIFADGIGVTVDMNYIKLLREVYEIRSTDILLHDRYQQMKQQILEDVENNLYNE